MRKAILVLSAFFAVVDQVWCRLDVRHEESLIILRERLSQPLQARRCTTAQSPLSTSTAADPHRLYISWVHSPRCIHEHGRVKVWLEMVTNCGQGSSVFLLYQGVLLTVRSGAGQGNGRHIVIIWSFCCNTSPITTTYHLCLINVSIIP